MAKVKTNWHSMPANDHQKDIIIERFRRYLKNIGLHEETINLYMGRVRAFLDFANSQDPDVALADRYREMLIEKGLSRSLPHCWNVSQQGNGNEKQLEDT